MSKKFKILIVDDEESIREFLEIMLVQEGYLVSTAKDGKEAMEMVDKKSYDLIISDLQMPHVSGMQLLEHIKSHYPATVFLLITAFGTTDTAIEAMKKGAYDYITKPFQIDEVRLNIQNALQTSHLKEENRGLRAQVQKSFHFQNLIGDSQSMHHVFDMIQRVASTPTSILLTGQSGTGKEMVAKAVHYSGDYKSKPFISVNCGAIPENLMESEMFGHKKGSFTGAVSDKKGLFEVADGGTLFLDEIGELPLSIQVKLLRALQEQVIRRVGGVEDTSVNVRIIAATNRDLKQMTEDGGFRQDLYYRLNVIQILLPTLTQRRKDIPLLANHFLKKYNERLHKEIKGISAEAMNILSAYAYPGNVRELENIIERTVALEMGSIILPESLPPLVNVNSKSLSPTDRLNFDRENPVDLDKILSQIEKEFILKAMHESRGVKKHAAKLLGMSFRSLRYRFEKLGLGEFEASEEAA